MVDVLTTKVKAWEKERGVPFLCDKVTLTMHLLNPLLWSAYMIYALWFQQPLLQRLEEDIVIRAQREEEKRQFRVCLQKHSKTLICSCWANKTKLFFLFCINRSRNDYKVSLRQRKKQSMVQSLQRRSHWDRVWTQTMWLKLPLVDALGIHLDVLLLLVAKIIEAMPRYHWTMLLFRKTTDDR